VNPISYYLNGEPAHDVSRPDVTSDRKHVTSPERDRKPHLSSEQPEVGVAEDLTVVSAQTTVDLPRGQQHGQDGGRSSEGRPTSAKLLERRGRMTQEHQMRLMIDELKTKQPELQSPQRFQGNSASPVTRQVALVATSGELSGAHSPSRAGPQNSPLPVDVIRHHQRWVESAGAQPPPYSPTNHRSPSPSFMPELAQFISQHDQRVSPARYQNVSSPSGPSRHHLSCPRLESDVRPAETAADRRQREYEAGLRKFGPNHRPQHSYSADDDYERHPASKQTPYNGIITTIIIVVGGDVSF